MAHLAPNCFDRYRLISIFTALSTALVISLLAVAVSLGAVFIAIQSNKAKQVWKNDKIVSEKFFYDPAQMR